MDYQKLTQGEIKQALDFSAAQIKKVSAAVYG